MAQKGRRALTDAFSSDSPGRVFSNETQTNKTFSRTAKTSPSVIRTVLVTPDKKMPSDLFLTPAKWNNMPSKVPSPRSSSPGTVVRLRQTLGDLRNRVLILEGNTGRNELLNIIHEQEQEIKQKEQEFRLLTTKVEKIKRGLRDIEQERSTLTNKASRLESEKKAIEKELENRVKEISFLNARYSSQMEKIKEATTLRSENCKLHEQVRDLTKSLQQRETEDATAASIRSQLVQTEIERDELIQRLQRIEDDFKTVQNSLHECLVNSEKLMKEKRSWEAERHRIIRQAELEGEKQRQSHIQATIELSEELKARHETVRQLEESLENKELAITKLREDLVEAVNQKTTLNAATETLIDKQHTFLEEVELDHERQRLELKEALKARHETVRQLEESLENKELAITKLREDLAEAVNQKMTSNATTKAVIEKQQTILRQAELEYEKQRQSHIQATTELKEELKALHETVRHLDSSLQNKELVIMKLREDLAEAVCQQTTSSATTEAVIGKQQEAVAELRKQNDHAISDLKAAHKCEIERKDYMIEALEREMENMMAELMVSSSSLQKAEGNMALFEDLTADIEALQQENETFQEQLGEKNLQITELEAEILKLEIENSFTQQNVDKVLELQNTIQALAEEKRAIQKTTAMQLNVAKEHVRALELQVMEMQSAGPAKDTENEYKRIELEEKVSKLECELKMKGMELATQRAQTNNLVNKVHYLEEELSSSNESKQLLQKHLKDERDDAVNTLNIRLESLENSLKREASTNDDALVAKEKAIAMLKLEVSSKHEELLSQHAKHNEDLNTLRDELKAATSCIASKDNELRDLRFVEIPQLKDTILTFQNKMSRAESKQAAYEAEVEGQVKNSSEQVAKMQARLDEQDRVAEKRGQEHRDLVAEMSGSINDLENELVQKEKTTRDLQRRCAELDDANAQSSLSIASLETENAVLRKECQQLRQTISHHCTERKGLLSSLERHASSVEKLKGLEQSTLEKLKTSQDAFLDAQRQLAIKNQKIDSLDSKLSETLSKLNGAVSQNKTLEIKLEHQQLAAAGHSEIFEDLQNELTRSEEELAEVKKDWKMRETEYEDRLLQEANHREIMEADLKAVRFTMDRLKKEVKDQTEIEKENMELKDKIRRQDTYMLRKMEKEKLMRERSNKPLTSHHSSSKPQRTPARRVARATHNLSMNTSLVTTPTNTTSQDESTVDLDLDLELESLLAD